MSTSAVPTPESPIDWAAAGKAFGVGVTTVDEEKAAASAPIDWAAEGKKFGAGVSTVDQERHTVAQPPPVIDWAAEGKKFGAQVSTVDQEVPPKPPSGPQLVLPEKEPPPPPMMTHPVAAPGQPPTKTTYPAPPVVPKQEPTFNQARQQAAQMVGDAVDKNLDFLVGPYFGFEKGIIKSAAQMATDPVTGAVMAGTAGLAAVPGAVGTALGTGLSAYFATEAGKAFLQRFPTIRDAVAQGDYQQAAEEGGGALADALMAYGAAMHAARGVRALPSDIARNAQQFRARFGPLKPVSGTVEPPINPYQGVQQMGAPAVPPTFEGQAEPGEAEPGVAPPPAAPAEPEINYADPSTLGGPFAAPAAGPPSAEPPPTLNAKAFAKAHNLWNDARIRTATEHMEKFPGTSFEQALAATEGTYGLEPRPEDFMAPPEPAPPPPEPEAPPAAEPPPPPEKVERVSPDTPNPPTAALATQPESPETIALQMGQLRDGTRRVVMFPQGQGQPLETEHYGTAPIGITHDNFGNTYAYRKDLIATSAIHEAARNNTLPEVLGSVQGMGAPDKSALQGEPITVVGRGPDGTEAQSTVTDAANLPATHAATAAVTPPGGTVGIENPADVLAERAGEVPAAASEPSIAPTAIIKRRPGLAPDEQQVQDVVINRVEAGLPHYVDAYLQRFGTHFSSDNAAQLFPEYDANPMTRGRYRYAVGGAARTVEEAAFDHVLATSPHQQVVLITGGTAAGKSSSVEPYVAAGRIVLDDPLSHTDQTEALINNILAHGHSVSVIHVQRDPMEAFAGNLNRALVSPTEQGRVAPIDIFAGTHINSARTTQEMAQKFAGNPRVKFEVVVNQTGRPRRMGSLDDLKATDYNGLQEKAQALLNAEHAAGRIDDYTYANAQPRSTRVAPTGRGVAAADAGSGAGDGRPPEPQVSSEVAPPSAGRRAPPQNYRQLVKRAQAANVDPEQFEKSVAGRAALRAAIEAKEQADVQRNNPQTGASDLGTPGQPPANNGEGNSASGAVPNGNGPVHIRPDTGERGAETHDSGVEPNTGDLSQGVRRITGSADIPLLPAGERQAARMMKAKAKKKFNLVISGPSDRAIETGSYFGKPIPSDVFDGWARAEYEGQPAAAVSDEMKSLMLNPDVVPPGVSALSGKPGMSWNQAFKPMFKQIQDIALSIGPSQRVLIVTSGGNLQAIDAWGKAGYPADFDFSHAAMAAEPHWSVTGKMFTMGPHGLEEVPDNKVPGRLYLIEHAQTAYNPKTPQKTSPAAKGKVALERRRDFYRVGNIVQGYGGGIDRVLDYDERPDGTWNVRVQALRPDLTVDPDERPRLHSTEPDKNGKVLYRAAVESERGAERRGERKSEVLGPRRPSYQSWTGNPTIIRVPGEDTVFQARYGVRELEDVIPSHNPITLDHNPDFQHRNDRNYKDPINSERIFKQTTEFDPGYVAVESPDANNGGPVIDHNGNVLGGNSRAMTIARVYAMNPAGAAAYKAALEQKAASFGLDGTRIAAMRRPVLVRELDRELSPAEAQAAITDFNKIGTAALTPDEQAIRDSNRVSPETVEYIGNLLNEVGDSGTLAQALEGPGGAHVIEKLMDDGVVSIAEKAKLVKDGLLTPAGKDRIAKLLVGRLFADPAHLEATPADLRNKLERIIAPLVRIGDPAWNLLPEVRAAVAMIDDANSRGIKNLTDLVAQTGLFGDDTVYPQKVVDLAEFIKANGPLKLAKAFSQYATDSTGSLFMSLSPDEAFAQAFKPDAPPLETPGVYMGMGLGAMQPYLDAAGKAAAQYAREEALPAVERLIGGGRQIVAAMVHMFSPRTGVAQPILDSIYRMRGGREAAQFLLTSKLDKWSDAFRAMNQAQMVDFIDRQKTGQSQATPELQNLSDFLRRVDDALYQQVARYKPSLSYLENHYRVLWKVLPGSTGRPRGFAGVFRAPLQGSRGFLKQHTLADMSEGLRQGGVPYSYNPIVMFTAHYADTMKYVTAQHLWEQWGADGTRKFVKTGKQPPAGYEKLNDAIAKVYFPQPAGLVHTGDWYVNEGAARLLNNHLGRDYLRQIYSDAPASQISGNLGKFMLGVKNATTAIELSLSPFHAVFETFEAMGSQIGYGMRKVWNLGVARGDWHQIGAGMKDIGAATVAPYTVSRLGGQAKRAYGDFERFRNTPTGQQWLKDNPTARDGVQYYFLGGGTMGLPPDFQINAEKSFLSYLRSARAGGNPGHYISAGLRSIPAFFSTIMKPLFETYIPNLKLGFFLKEFALAQQEMAGRINSGQMTLQQLARQTVDSVENRFGEMNFDNLFWDRTFKTAAQIIFRSVTWKLGNLRAEAGAVAGQVGEFRQAFKDKSVPQLHGSMAWFIGMSVLTAAIGAIITKATTGKNPKQFKDFVYPVIDPAANVRISLPTYWRDILHFAHSPKGYLTSSQSGEIGRVLEVVENKDFYGNSVYNEDDPLIRQWLDKALHFVPFPFSLSSYQAAKGQGGSDVAKYAGYLGFTKAPKYIEQSRAQQLAAEYGATHREVGSRTAYQAARAKAEAGIRNTMRRGGNTTEAIHDAESKGLIVPKDLSQLQKQSQASELKHAITGLSMAEALHVYDAATPTERAEIQRDVRNKIYASAKHRPGEFGLYDSDTRKLAQKYFNFKPPIPAGLQPPQAMGTPAPIQ